jgi:hypothetical protein
MKRTALERPNARQPDGKVAMRGFIMRDWQVLKAWLCDGQNLLGRREVDSCFWRICFTGC